MKNKKLYIVGGLIVVSIIAIIIYKRKSKSKSTGTSQKASSPLEKVTEIFTGKNENQVSGYTINNQLNSKGNFQFPAPKQGVDLKSKAITNILSCLDFERRNTYDVYKSKGDVLYNIGRDGSPDTIANEKMAQLWYSRIEQLVQHLESSLKADTTINKETKEYAGVLLQTFRSWLMTIFPSSKYNANTDFYKKYAKDYMTNLTNYQKGCQY